MDEKNDFQNLDKLVIASGRTGRPVLRIGFQMQLYLRGGDDPATRHRVVDALAGFAKAAARNVTQYQKHMASRMTPIAGKDLPALLHDEVDRLDPQVDIYGPHVSDAQEPPRWQGAALLQPARAMPVDLSVFHLAMPATLAKENPDDLIARMSAWCRQVQPLHGTAGLAPIYEIGMQRNYPDETWPLLSRFSGLDYMNAFVLAARGVNQIQCINWLTILGTPILAEIGGAEELARLLAAAARDMAATEDEQPRLYPYEGGMLIRAGRYPQLGDRNIGGVPKSYRIVNKVLRPWLFTDYLNKPTRLFKVPRPLDPFDETLRRLGGFIAPGLNSGLILVQDWIYRQRGTMAAVSLFPGGSAVLPPGGLHLDAEAFVGWILSPIREAIGAGRGGSAAVAPWRGDAAARLGDGAGNAADRRSVARSSRPRARGCHGCGDGHGRRGPGGGHQRCRPGALAGRGTGRRPHGAALPGRRRPDLASDSAGGRGSGCGDGPCLGRGGLPSGAAIAHPVRRSLRGPHRSRLRALPAG
ncbi:type VI immunity family protein [Paracoccus sp. S1E-3]|uniref:type VI immunity family protein n=1 Tax=Paracoccus sp. S1E-3 TaxID=2756130 RepID=UPI0015EF93BE|nr:type VI immunity family protein [Paracoccus sp. S1E-3]MBA4491617.1 DUF3396 domain-containing protein [Paracoccus sp. S1E-3]